MNYSDRSSTRIGLLCLYVTTQEAPTGIKMKEREGVSLAFDITTCNMIIKLCSFIIA